MRCDLQIALGNAWLRLGDIRYRDLVLAAGEGARQLGDSRRIGRAALALTSPTGFFGAAGTVDAALVTLAEEALASLPEGDEEALRARLLAAVAYELVWTFEYGRRDALSLQAVDAARRSGDVGALGRALYIRLFAGLDPAEFDARRRCVLELIALGEEHGDLELLARGQIQYYEILLEDGDGDAAMVALDDADRLARELRTADCACHVAYNRAAYAIFAGHFAEAERLATEIPVAVRAASRNAPIVRAMQLAILRWEQGSAAEAIDAIAAMAEATPDHLALRIVKALLEANAGQVDVARSTLQALTSDGYEGVHRNLQWGFNTVMKALTVALLADRRRAELLYEELLPWAGRTAGFAYVSSGPVDLALAVLAVTLDKWDDAEQYFQTSAELSERLGTPTWLARTQCEWAAMLSARGDPQRSRDLATQALAAAEVIGMAGVAEKARSLLRVPLPRLLTRAEQFEFVGRAAERATLADAWTAAQSGNRRVVLVAGEPGAGKTRLASEFARVAHAEGALVLGGRCDEGMGVPYQPFVEALRWHIDHTSDDDLVAALGRWPGELTRLVPEIADRVPGATPSVSSDPETERYRLFEAIASWLGVTPLVLVLDDLQWAASPTLLLLSHVVRTTTGERLLVVGTYRDTESEGAVTRMISDLGRESGSDRLVLRGLDASEVQQLAATANVDPGNIHAASGGNPFFVGALLQHRADSKERGIPTNVIDVVTGRVQRLPEDVQIALRTGAVIGEEFEIEVLTAATDSTRGEVVRLLDAAADARLIAGNRTQYRFSHALVRETLTALLSEARLGDLHRQVGEAIETTFAPSLDHHLSALASHFAEAGLAAKAADYSARAGDFALTQHANDEAARLFAVALNLVGDNPARAMRSLDQAG